MKKISLSLVLIAMLSLMQSNAFAEEHYYEHHDMGRHEHHEVWHGDIHHFHERDFDIWRSGHWMHARHQGSFGWWWVVNGVWYAYPTAIYPYPDPYTPPVILVPPPQAAIAPNSPAPEQVWYYCSNPQGYYPYIAQCLVPWQKVPETQAPQMP